MSDERLRGLVLCGLRGCTASCPLHLQIGVDLRNPNPAVQEQAAVTLANSAVDQASKLSIGKAGTIDILRQILAAPDVNETLLAAAILALWVCCSDCPANACLLVDEFDLQKSDPPRLAGLDRVLRNGLAATKLAAGDMKCRLEDVFHIKRALALNFELLTQEYGKSLLGGYLKGPTHESARLAVLAVSKNARASSWGSVLPHCVVKEWLVIEKVPRYWFGVALVFRSIGEAATALRMGCLPLLVELLEDSSKQVGASSSVNVTPTG